MAEDRLEAWLDGEWLAALTSSVRNGNCRLFIIYWDPRREDGGSGEAPLRLRRLLRAIALRLRGDADGPAVWKQAGSTLALLTSVQETEWDEETGTGAGAAGGRLAYLLKDTIVRTMGGKHAAKLAGHQGTLRWGSSGVVLPKAADAADAAGMPRVQDESGVTAERRKQLRRSAEEALWSAWLQAWEALRDGASVLQTGLPAEAARESAGTGEIEVRYAPIVSLFDGSLFGYEAIPYRKRTGRKWGAESMFAAAEKEGALYECDRRFREAAIRGLPVRHGEAKLFLPASAAIIYDARLYPGTTLRRMEAAGIRPEQVVLCFYAGSEREGRDDAALRSVFRHYRAQGFRIALLGVSVNARSLRRMLSLHPDYVRLDTGWMTKEEQGAGEGTGEETDADVYPGRTVDEMLLQALAGLARREQIVLMAGNVERDAQLTALVASGVSYGQGSRIGSEEAVPSLAPNQVRERIRLEVGKRYRKNAGSLSELTMPVEAFDRSTLVSEVARQFEQRRDVTCFVIAEEGRPVGLLMKEKLHQLLSGQFGLPLYWNRPVDKMMDTQPMIVEESLPIDQVSQMAMAREPDKLYDAVIVTREGRVAGIASIRSLLEWVTNARMTDARWANPLTGLPGNEPIRRELVRRLGEGKPFAVLYADLDYFKWFNDRFGFHRGDEVIRFTAETLAAVVSVGSPDAFVGHIGGDDLIAVMNRDEAVTLAGRVLERFDQGIGGYVGADAGPVVDREGRPADADGLSISLSLLLCEESAGWTPELLAERSALLKKEAKRQRGSALVWDRLVRPSHAAGAPDGERGAPDGVRQMQGISARRMGSTS